MANKQDAPDGNAPAEPVPATPERDVGLMPAFMALLMIGAIGLLVACGIGSCMVFNKSPTLAAGTLKAHYIPLVEQSNLDPEEKKLVVGSLRQVVTDLETGQWEPYQANQLMHNLLRAPVVQWGDLDALEQIIAQRAAFSEQESADAANKIGRIKYGVGEDLISANDIEDAIAPVTEKVQSERGARLFLNPDDASLREALHRFDLLLDREKIPAQVDTVTLSDVVRLQIEKAMSK